MSDFEKAINAQLIYDMLQKGHGYAPDGLSALGVTLQDDLRAAVTGQTVDGLGFSFRAAVKKIGRKLPSARLLKRATHKNKATKKITLARKMSTAAAKKIAVKKALAAKAIVNQSPDSAKLKEFLAWNVAQKNAGNAYFTPQGVINPANPTAAPVPTAMPVTLPAGAAAVLPPPPVYSGAPDPNWQPPQDNPDDNDGWVPDTVDAGEAPELPDYAEYDAPETPVYDAEIEAGGGYDAQPQFFDVEHGIDGLDGFLSKVASKVKNVVKKTAHVVTLPHKKLAHALGIKTPPAFKRVESAVKKVGRAIDRNKMTIIAASAVIYAGYYFGPKIAAALMKSGGVSAGTVAAGAKTMGVPAAAVASITSATPTAADAIQAGQLANDAGFWSKVTGAAGAAMAGIGAAAPAVGTLVNAGLQVDAAKFQQKMAIAEVKAQNGQPWEAATTWEEDYNAPGAAEQVAARNMQGKSGAGALLIPAALAAFTLLK